MQKCQPLKNGQILITEPIPDLPEQKKMFNDCKPDELLICPAEIPGCDLQRLKRARKVSRSAKTNRDFLIYLLWQTGRFSKVEIGESFGLIYSSVTRGVNVLKNRLENVDEFRGWYETL